MDSFLSAIEVLAGLSVLIAVVSNYLIINKLWTRRANKDVAESISVSAALLGIVTTLPFFVQFVLVNHNLTAAAKTFVGLITGFFFVGIGSGIWVRKYNKLGFLDLLLRALRLERKESSNLLKATVQPSGAIELLKIFEALVKVDRKIDAKEIRLIQDFSKRWSMDMPELEEGGVVETTDILFIRSAIVDYLAIHPPANQAAELVDVIDLFVKADGSISHEEGLILREGVAMIDRYVSSKGAVAGYEVVIVPQSEAQTEALKALIPGVEPVVKRGGVVYSVGRYYSAEFADAVSDKYIALGLFTTRLEVAAVE